MSRLESSARDFAIATLSACRSTYDGSLPLDDATYDALRVARADMSVPWRVANARLALWLRLQRRAEAWERDEADHARDMAWERQHGSMHCPHDDTSPDDWARPETEKAAPFPFESADLDTFDESYRAWRAAPYRFRAWRPLWTFAPPWSPVITPAMRRDGRERVAGVQSQGGE